MLHNGVCRPCVCHQAQPEAQSGFYGQGQDWTGWISCSSYTMEQFLIDTHQHLSKVNFHGQ